MTPLDVTALLAAGAALLLIVSRVLRIRQSGVRVNTLGHQKAGVHRLLEIMLLPLAGLFLLELILHAAQVPWHVLTLSDYPAWFHLPLLRTVGAATLALALIILFLALRDFGASYRLGVDHHNPGALVTHGIFSYSRHPVYLGLDLFFLGQFLLYPNTFFFWMFAGAAGTMHFLARKEEAYLTSRHGADYQDYARRVPRYFGVRAQAGHKEDQQA